MREVDRLINSGHCAILILNGEWRGGGGGGGGALSGTWKDGWFEMAATLVVHRRSRIFMKICRNLRGRNGGR